MSRTSASRKSSNRLLMPSAIGTDHRGALRLRHLAPRAVEGGTGSCDRGVHLSLAGGVGLGGDLTGDRVQDVERVAGLDELAIDEVRQLPNSDFLAHLGTLAFSVLIVLLLGRTLGQGLVAGGPVRLGHLTEDDPHGLLLGHVGLHHGFGQLADQCLQLLGLRPQPA